MEAIKVEGVSKQYRLGQVGTGSLKHDMNRWWHRVQGKEDPYLKIGESNDRTQKGGSEYVWSLRDVSFAIEQGDSVGIIGRNGAGKSTLLKILSRVTAPTTGRVKVKGRIASLLEVGTGFHPDLSGRENIYLNGAILGMRKHEIKGKFDEIVAFAGVERYIDTPVKRYSSGMYVRLAFAVAAHLESEILIVDEVLAVGDAEFQKKCIGKMNDVSKGEGRTILFVSHNMGSITQLCNKGILLKNGKVEFSGSTKNTIQLYNKQDKEDVLKSTWVNRANKYYDDHFYLKKVVLVDSSGKEKQDTIVSKDEVLRIVFEGEIATISSALKIGYELIDEEENLVFTSLCTDPSPSDWVEFKLGSNKIASTIPVHLLKPGNYTISIHVSLHHQKWICHSGQQEVRLGFCVINGPETSPYLDQSSGAVAIANPFYQI